ncbi:F-box only protein 22 [Callorhinchus milii]|nr:F-box only protein 22 [Callorhinchus milii]
MDGAQSKSLDGASSVLSSVAEVVERIMLFLPTKSLLGSARVCRLWRDCARRVIRMHQKLSWISAKGLSDLDDDDGDHFLVKKMITDLEDVYVLPQTVLYMTGTDTFSSRRRRKERKNDVPKRNRDAEVAAEVERLLPIDCKAVGFSAPGIVYTPMGCGRERPREEEDGTAGFALLLPKIEGVTIKFFHFSNKNLKDKAFDQEKLRDAGLQDNPDLRAVLLFGYNTMKEAATNFLQRLTQQFSVKSTVVAGGHIDRVFSPRSERIDVHHSYGFVGLAFSGRPIQAASVLLGEDVDTPESVEAAMQRLKAANIPESNTVGFMFTCIGRGQDYYSNKENVEADAFRKQFPTIPLFGFFGNGEIGCDRIVTENFSLRECSNSKDCNELFHDYTTVMALIHLGPVK